MPSQHEIRTQITQQIIAALESRKLPPWRKPWRSLDANAGHPCNVMSRNRYSGVNPLLLEIAAERHGFRSKWWATFRQWQELGGRVKKRPADVPPGSWGTSIVFCKPVTKAEIDEDGEEVEEKFWVLRTYTVFNLDQVDGPFDHLRVGHSPVSVHEVEQRFEHADAVIEATGADIRYGGDKAFYSLTDDYIQLPPRHLFERPEAFYQTAGHELIHWTEHATRLNRDRSESENSYAYLELVAEIGGCFLMGALSLPTDGSLENHAAYLKHWLKALKDDSRLIFRAAAEANKAVDFILSFSREPQPEPALVG
jgi:antirestriction protein ArdC